MKTLVTLFLVAACTLPSVAQALTGKYTTESDALMDGDLAVSEYTIDTVQGISAVSAENGQVTVQLLDAAPAGASICIGSATDTGSIISADVPEGAKSLTISAPQLTMGVHAVTLNVDDEKIDSKKFVKLY